jgi:hypothetical protein
MSIAQTKRDAKRVLVAWEGENWAKQGLKTHSLLHPLEV